jgi:hypothetical protein
MPSLMKKRLTAVLLLLLSVAASRVAAQSQQWQKTTVGDSVTVEFPGTPRQKEMESKLGPALAYVLNDGDALYLVLAQKGAMEEESSSVEVAEFYAGVMRGTGGKY